MFAVYDRSILDTTNPSLAGTELRRELIIGWPRTELCMKLMYARHGSLYSESRLLALDLISDNFVTPAAWNVHTVFCAKKN